MDNYAYGWVVYKVQLGETADSLNVISHSGDINGFNSRIFRLVDDKHLIVVLNNTGNTDMRGICTAITNILYDLPYELPKISIALTIGKIILKSGVDAAIKKYIELKLTKEDEYNFVESQLNILGYQLLAMNRVKDAIEIFKLNVEEYPNIYNPYDSLGEAYMIDGQNDLAIKNYTKSLELNPNNTNAVKMLEKLNQ
jgi:tetratricopeptide (TPR) repeat protein